MTTCKNCSFYFAVPENAGDFEAGKGDCVIEKEDAKGKYWLSKPTRNDSPSCKAFKTA
ncbi:Benzylsuccinate synthase gamma subunit [Geobacter metallireducens RCH3]|uniref:(R)-benzylsuccinate synthase, gamma subunit n=1 Tax=Geobacter metallireducens (strain ATCC 53774 / DSM 7210 / GS-15) TaxID=269799 RepID=Q39VF0_GEOMG|nr:MULTISPECIES: benzylsuccinate synthase gamma subunit family protein [Geobacter]ABB31774.1 (R)-benzylsuccinate synthase, gamma subunit [Geobacter metallireducens GS-15]EHP89347.1 Benzylsuccinate synthase gamma subunit [Geobacter metallireducens RCH3]MBT1075813.1 benzylsuccinate synthase gamma subunit family protein [Geobacter grbiciae]